MRRREFLTAFGAMAISSRLARAQPRLPRLAVVNVALPVSQLTQDGSPPYRAFFEELRRLGHIEGRSIIVERWSADGREERFAELARQVTQSRPDVIFAVSARFLSLLKAATADIPIVAFTGDPVGNGLVQSLARPGGNITGVTLAPGHGVNAKQLELLKELRPAISRLAYLASRSVQASAAGRALQVETEQAAVSLMAIPLENPLQDTDYRQFFAAASEARADAVIAADMSENLFKIQLIAELAAAHRIPVVYPHGDYVRSGGLMSYGYDPSDTYRRLAGYVSQVLKGADPGTMPFFQPTRLSLTLNAKAAQALGLVIPASILARADEVVE